jgi:hypothetical protein
MTLELDPQSVIDPRRVFLAPVRFLPQVISHMILQASKVSEKDNLSVLYKLTLIDFIIIPSLFSK